MTSALVLAQEIPREKMTNGVLLEVVRKSWSVERKESLVYLRVYADGLAEAHPMREVDFRRIQFLKEQIPQTELTTLRELLTDPAIVKLRPEYDSFWGNKDFGYEYDVTIPRTHRSQAIVLANFQPFLAREKGKPYPRQLEKLGCLIWKLRSEVSREPLEKNWLKGCSDLGY